MRSLLLVSIVFAAITTCGCAGPVRKHNAEEQIPKPRMESLQELKTRIDTLLGELASSEYEERETAQTGLQKLLHTRSGIVLGPLQEAHETTKDAEVRERLQGILKPYIRWRITPAVLDAIPNVVQLLGTNTDESRHAAMQALKKLGTEDSRGVLLVLRIERLMKQLKNKYPRVRRRAVDGLGETGGKRAVSLLIEALKDEDGEVRRHAVDGLGKTGGKRAVPFLIEVLKDEDGDVRRYAALALGAIGDKKAVEPLIEVLQKEDWYVHGSVATALRMIGKPAVEHLIAALKDRRWWVRWTASSALGDIGDKRAVETLVDALRDENDFVRSDASEALEKITKQNFGMDYDKWKQWYEKNRDR